MQNLRLVLAAAVFAGLADIGWSTAAAPQELSGRVVGVTDGDTLTVLTAGRRPVKVRLLAVGAPETSCKGRKTERESDLFGDAFCVERGQPYGKAAKKALSQLTFGRDVIVRVRGTSHERLVGQVLVGQTDAGLAMLQQGFACYAAQFGRRHLSDEEQRAYAQAHEAAKAARRGMWAREDAQCDDEYRARQRSAL